MNYLYNSIDFVKRPFKGLNMLNRMLYYAHQSSIESKGFDFLNSFYKAFILYLKDGFLPEEAYQYGFLYKNFRYGEHQKYVSKKRMLNIQQKINPISLEMLTEDKAIFYNICQKADIPVPETLGIVFKNLPGFSINNNKSFDRKNWKQFCFKSLPNEFLIKPARGCYGRRIKIFKRNGMNFIDEMNVELEPNWIYDYMVNDKTYDCFIIQERLENHNRLSELSNTEALQTIRVITHIDRDGNCNVIYAYLKPIVGKNIVDNQNYGRTGNLLSKIDIIDGKIQSSVYMASNPCRIHSITKHPETGIEFFGFKIPEWEYVLKYAIRAAEQFAPIRTIGWDVAITPDGPIIIEGNITWDPPKFGDINKIIEEIKK